MLRTLPAVVLVLACAAVYAGELGGPLLFDDQQSIVDNPTLRALHFPEVMQPPRETPVAGRPLPNLSFALNYAATGLSADAFHATNLLFHVLVVLLAFALLRLTFAHGLVPDHLRRHADALAFTSALLFAVHPLCVELVLYATQRTESLMAIFYVVALCLVACAACAGKLTPLQLTAAFVCALCGGLSKEVFATAPVLALFFDRAFFAGSFSTALRARGKLYLALAASWLPFVFLQRSHPRPDSVRFGELSYLIAQAKLIPEYIAAAFWPAHPALDYGPLLPQHAAQLAPYILGTSLFVLASCVLAFTHPRLGFVGVFLLGILAPSSSLFSVHTEVGAERRIYLPLIALLAYGVVAVDAALSRAADGLAWDASMRRVSRVSVALLVALALGVHARAHAATFASVRSAWLTAARARPENPRAHYNLAETYRREGDLPRARAAFRAAIARNPEYADAHANLGGVLLAQGKLEDGLRETARSVLLAPKDPNARYGYALALGLAGRLPEAALQLTATLALRPDHLEARLKLAFAQLSLGQLRAARLQIARLTQQAPRDPRVAALAQRLREQEEVASAAPTLHAAPWPEANAFHASGAWLGADSAYSVDLGSRVLWLFGDSFIDPRADGSRENGPNFFIRNSVAIQAGADADIAHDLSRAELHYYWGPNAHGAPTSFFSVAGAAADKAWFWPLDGALLPDGKLLLFRMQLAPETGGLGFAVTGWDAVAIDDPRLAPDAWRPRRVMQLTPAAAPNGKLLGASVLLHEDYLYVYAAQNDPKAHALYLARYALASLVGLPDNVLVDPEWWCGARGFVKQSAGAEPAQLFPDGQIELSVSYLPKVARFVEVQTRGGLLGDPNTAIAARFAPQPQGPWTALTPFYRPAEASRPDAANLLTYAAKAHPEQRGAALVLTYVVNDLKHPTPADALYYPRALRVTLDGAAAP